ncbi:MAG: Enoyl-CoA hydratase/isomerase [Solirubrobacterales bacterium]|nr:Enoyl-CoA hydratase/isomerase [Solirubrobacterales bacterium]
MAAPRPAFSGREHDGDALGAVSTTTAVRTEVAGDGVLRVVLARTERRNAIDVAAVDALHHAMDAAEVDGVRAVVLTSAEPGVFCAGADIRIGDDERAYVSDRLYALYERLLELPAPVVAAVDGAAVGGGAQLVMASDISIGGPSSRFRFAGAGHGLAVSAWALPSLVGRGRALDLCLSMRWVARQEAFSLGLLTRTAQDAPAAAHELATELVRRDPRAVARIKRLVNEPDLLERLRRERTANAQWNGSVEGVEAREQS